MCFKWCCKRRLPESIETIVVKNDFKVLKNGIENFAYVDVHSESEIRKNKSSSTDNNELPANNTHDQNTNTGESKLPDSITLGNETQSILVRNSPRNRSPRFYKNGEFVKPEVKWADIVNPIDNSVTPENSNPETTGPIRDSSEDNIPIIVVTEVDGEYYPVNTDQAELLFNSYSENDHSPTNSVNCIFNMECTKILANNETTKHTHVVEHCQLEKNVEISSNGVDLENYSAEPIVPTVVITDAETIAAIVEEMAFLGEVRKELDIPQKSVQRKLSLEDKSVEHKRLTTHLTNMADHIQKLASLIDRFDGVFVNLLQDEIEDNLKSCNEKISDVECKEYDNILKLKNQIQERIDRCMAKLEGKSVKNSLVHDGDEPEVTSMRKIEDLKGKVDMLCSEIHKLDGIFLKVAYNDCIENLQKYHDEIETINATNNEKLRRTKHSMQEKIGRYLEILDEKHSLFKLQKI